MLLSPPVHPRRGSTLQQQANSLVHVYYSNVKARLRDRAENNLPWLMDRVIQPWSIVFFFPKNYFLKRFSLFGQGRVSYES